MIEHNTVIFSGDLYYDIYSISEFLTEAKPSTGVYQTIPPSKEKKQKQIYTACY
jgi:hypothetical protein